MDFTSLDPSPSLPAFSLPFLHYALQHTALYTIHSQSRPRCRQKAALQHAPLDETLAPLSLPSTALAVALHHAACCFSSPQPLLLDRSHTLGTVDLIQATVITNMAGLCCLLHTFLHSPPSTDSMAALACSFCFRCFCSLDCF